MGFTFDGQKMPIQQCFNALRNGSLKSVVFSTTGGMGGGSGEAAPLAGAFSLAVGRQQGGRRRPGSGTGLTISGEDGSILTAISLSVDDLPSYDGTSDNFWGIGNVRAANPQISVTPQRGIWVTRDNSYWAKLVQGFNATQTENCRNFIERILSQHGINTAFDTLLSQAKFNLYNPGAERARAVWAPNGEGYRQLNSDVQSVGQTLQGLFSEGWPGSALAVTLGNNVYLSAGNFINPRANAGVLVAHELLHVGGIRTIPGKTILIPIVINFKLFTIPYTRSPIDPISNIEGDLKRECAPDLRGN